MNYPDLKYRLWQLQSGIISRKTLLEMIPAIERLALEDKNMTDKKYIVVYEYDGRLSVSTRAARSSAEAMEYQTLGTPIGAVLESNTYGGTALDRNDKSPREVTLSRLPATQSVVPVRYA